MTALVRPRTVYLSTRVPLIQDSGANEADMKLKEDGTPPETPAVAMGDLNDCQEQLAVPMSTQEAESFAQDEGP